MSVATQLPVLGFAELGAPLIALTNADATTSLITREQFLRTCLQLAAQLPNHRFAINLCQDRYYFMLGLVAACLRQQTNLLPASQASGALQVIASEYPDHHVMNDDSIAKLATQFSAATTPSDLPTIPADHVAAICFTSGSTGKPQAHPSSWGTLVASAKRSAAGIFGLRTNPLFVVATVPPQHMFGLETSILQPLMNNCAVHSSKPFFPADVIATLQSVPEPRALISTPAHLRACLAATGKTKLEFVLSATAPLAHELAAQTETLWETRVLEIYGSTETGAMATRRTTDGTTWHLLPGGTIDYDESTRFKPSDTSKSFALHDELQRIDDRQFALLGRSTDLIKIAGKRASLADLNTRLLAVPGVIDGVIFQPVEDQRVAALVIANVDERTILAALASHIDEVFLPRPLRLVTSLPRDAMGKLPRAALLRALQ